MMLINNLISDFSLTQVQQFFFQKISSFEPDEDVFYDIVGEDARFDDPIKIGQAELTNSDELLVFICKSHQELTARSGKKMQFDIAKKVLQEDFKDGAIFIFYDKNGSFRFSFIQRYYGQDEKFSNWKRYTYYVQPDKQNKTFRRQIGACDFSSLSEIKNAFSVEALSKEFYQKLSHWYFASLNEVEFPNENNQNQHQLNSQAMIRLITRMMFVWFMKEKGLVPEKLFDKSYIDTLLNYKDKTGSTYYKAILQNLFFATLNTEMGDKRKWITSSGYGVQHFYRYKRFFNQETTDEFLELMKSIPFLNGGLFENLDIVETANKEKNLPKKDIRIDCFSDNPKNEKRLTVPDFLFFGTYKADISSYLDDAGKDQVEIEGLINLLQRYDFTIDENSPNDQEVALDPELLGTVFENLLASYNPETQSTARKESGSFYTPRPIVDYMVKESFFYYLKEENKITEEKLRLLIEADDVEELSTEEKHDLVDSLTNIKILDPACGSGAFPMGVLQQMVRLLNTLDPENSIYKEKLQEKLKQELTQTIDQSNFEELKANIEEVFANQLNDPDYARKLFLIQNCLYGVDIQSIAMQITKLRFFISLLVEQQIDENQENFGVKPLPNLETKFVAANTLIGLDKQDGALKNIFIQEKEDELAEVREKYFSARTYETKRKYRAKDLELREEIAELLIDDGFAETSAKQISNWNPFDQNASSDWFDPEWMFGVDKFDLVIGNPPYIQLQKALPNGGNLKYADLYKNEGYSTFQRSSDIYALFYEEGLNLAKNGGLLCYITSNKWMRTAYGRSLRKFFAQKNPLLLIDMGPGIFEAATVDTNILIVQNKTVQQHALKAFPLEDKNQIHTLSKEQMTDMKQLSDESWIILNPEEMTLKEKIERIGTPLKDWDIQITYGIRTGYNHAYIIDDKTKKDLIRLDSKNKNLIKPILRGKDINRYKINFEKKWVILIHKGFANNFIKEYSHLYSFLSRFEKELKNRGQVKSKSHHWIELDNSPTLEYLNQFKKEKIIFQEMVQEPKFGYDKNMNYFCLDTARIITGENLRFLISVLNSKLFFYGVKRFYGGGGLGKTGVRMKHTFFNKFHIPKLSEEKMEPFEKIVDQILTQKENNEDTTAEENKIDVMVYKLYELTYDEVKIVDPEFWMSEEEYEVFEVNKTNDSFAN